MKFLFITVIIYLHVNSIHAQVKEEILFPEVGKPCPEFIIQNIHYLTTHQATLNEFRGKWLILDFWNQYCGACVRSFPKINELQKEFAARLQFILVGNNGSPYIHQSDGKSIERFYEIFREKQNLNLPVAYDSALFARFDIGACPHVIIIDDKGIVRGITASVNSDNLKELLTGKNANLESTYWRWHDQRIAKQDYDARKPLLINGNGGNDTNFIYRSILSPWNPLIPISIPNFSIKDFPEIKRGIFQILGVTLRDLYMFAYTGRNKILLDDSLYGSFFNSPIVEISDSSLFMPNYLTGSNLYSYSFNYPQSKANVKYIMQVMQRDLMTYFGYDIKIEIRKMPYWKLVATENAKLSLLTKGGPYSFTGNAHTGFTANNYPIHQLLSMVWSDNLESLAFIDETGIHGNIDIKLNCIMNDLNDVKKALQSNGLDLIKDEKYMKTIVIRSLQND